MVKKVADLSLNFWDYDLKDALTDGDDDQDGIKVHDFYHK